MKLLPYLLIGSLLIAGCNEKNDDLGNLAMIEEEGLSEINCSNAVYVPFSESPYMLPYEVGQSYRVDLNQCSSSYHAAGQPD
ncbi:hypothetical protein EAX61_11965 [Dokdonia sinensis]|uniref:Uncharacterized protein n=1 Tax=Dokdonia sinensis TaxID=2479847 RepID=A0A3M0GJH7_9FLAO|nr:hypothetical protein [Dokdonia sinensis]RMB57456.1 hypothetical protein EAX61_11965 [Dokdonia sinensis]